MFNKVVINGLSITKTRGLLPILNTILEKINIQELQDGGAGTEQGAGWLLNLEPCAGIPGFPERMGGRSTKPAGLHFYFL